MDSAKNYKEFVTSRLLASPSNISLAAHLFPNRHTNFLLIILLNTLEVIENAKPRDQMCQRRV